MNLRRRAGEERENAPAPPSASSSSSSSFAASTRSYQPSQASAASSSTKSYHPWQASAASSSYSARPGSRSVTPGPFSEADRQYRLDFGRNKGKTLDECDKTYVKWLRSVSSRFAASRYDGFQRALAAYGHRQGNHHVVQVGVPPQHGTPTPAFPFHGFRSGAPAPPSPPPSLSPPPSRRRTPRPPSGPPPPPPPATRRAASPPLPSRFWSLWRVPAAPPPPSQPSADTIQLVQPCHAPAAPPLVQLVQAPALEQEHLRQATTELARFSDGLSTRAGTANHAHVTATATRLHQHIAGQSRRAEKLWKRLFENQAAALEAVHREVQHLTQLLGSAAQDRTRHDEIQNRLNQALEEGAVLRANANHHTQQQARDAEQVQHLTQLLGSAAQARTRHDEIQNRLDQALEECAVLQTNANHHTQQQARDAEDHRRQLEEAQQQHQRDRTQEREEDDRQAQQLLDRALGFATDIHAHDAAQEARKHHDAIQRLETERTTERTQLQLHHLREQTTSHLHLERALHSIMGMWDNDKSVRQRDHDTQLAMHRDQIDARQVKAQALPAPPRNDRLLTECIRDKIKIVHLEADKRFLEDSNTHACNDVNTLRTGLEHSYPTAAASAIANLRRGVPYDYHHGRVDEVETETVEDVDNADLYEDPPKGSRKGKERAHTPSPVGAYPSDE